MNLHKVYVDKAERYGLKGSFVRKAVYWLILICIVYIFIEVSSLVTLFIVKEVRHAGYSPTLTTSLSDLNRRILTNLLKNNTYTSYITHSSTLGWTIKKNGVHGNMYRANSQGIRADRDYQFIPTKNIVRISCFGDSFTHCSDVKNEDTWEEQINAANKNLEVINFGVGGYGLDQAFLRYLEDGVLYNSHIVLIGFLPGETYRNVNVFCPFMTPSSALPLTKPRFVIENDRLVLIKNMMHELSQYNDLLNHPELILPKIGEYDYYFKSPTRYKKGSLDFIPSVRLFKIVRSKIIRLTKNSHITRNGYYNEDSEAYKITVKLFDEFVDSTINNNSYPIIILFPNREGVIRYRRNKTREYTPFLRYFKNKGYPYIDILDAFDMYGKNYEIDDLFIKHYSPLANRLVGKYILKYLQEKGFINSSAIKHKLQKM